MPGLRILRKTYKKKSQTSNRAWERYLPISENVLATDQLVNWVVELLIPNMLLSFYLFYITMYNSNDKYFVWQDAIINRSLLRRQGSHHFKLLIHASKLNEQNVVE